MHCIALYHVGFEDLGAFAAPLAERGYQITYQHAGTPLSREQWADTDLIVVLGGPIGVNDTALYPWLADEIEGLKLRLQLRRPTLGVCLGAQLMAVALGGAVGARSAGKEIGWSPLDLGAQPGPLAHLRDVPVLHWHGDNIALPGGLAATAATSGTPCQAFPVGNHALAVQFHAEFDPAALEQWLTGHAVELAHAGVDLARLRADTQRHGAALIQAGQAALRDWLDGLQQQDAILFHDGCKLCLDIAQTLSGTVPGLEIVDLGVHPEWKPRAEAKGVVSLPCLVVGGKVMPIAPHSRLDDIGAEGH